MRDANASTLLMFWLLPGSVVWGGLAALYVSVSALNSLTGHMPGLVAGICLLCLYGLLEMWLRLIFHDRIRPPNSLRKMLIMLSYAASLLMLSLPASMFFQMMLDPAANPIARLACFMAIALTIMPLALIGSGLVYEMFQQPSFHYRRLRVKREKSEL